MPELARKDSRHKAVECDDEPALLGEKYLYCCLYHVFLQCFDAVGSAAGRASGL